ncbi:MAG: 5-oxoprolinase subunit PxpA [Chitinophagaceae bacterium]
MLAIDLNCDMGETLAEKTYDLKKDLALLNYVSSVNLACGFHAGDPHTMHKLVKSAMEKGKAIGAHPGYPDKENFGRLAMPLAPEKIYDIILYQTGALAAFVQVCGGRLSHVKPHGALYNTASREKAVADAIARAVFDFDKRIIIYGLSGSVLIDSAQQLGLRTASEAFADRRYLADGSLAPRTETNALIEDITDCKQQVLQMVHEGKVTALNGLPVAVKAETICIHGDGNYALPFVQTIYETLNQHHVIIKQP